MVALRPRGLSYGRAPEGKGNRPGSFARSRALRSDERPQLLLEEGHADDGVAAVDRAPAVEVEEPRPRFLGQDLQGGEVPGLGRDLDPRLRAAGDDEDGVLAAAHAADGPVPGQVVEDSVGEGGGGDV